VQVDPIKPTLSAPRTKRLKLNCDDLLSSFAFKLNLRRYTKARLEPLYDALDACPLTALRQDAGLLVSTVIAIPFYLTHPKVRLGIY